MQSLHWNHDAKQNEINLYLYHIWAIALIHSHTQPHSATDTRTNPLKYIHTYIHTRIHKHREEDTLTHTHTTHTHTHTHTTLHTCTHTRAHTHTRMHTSTYMEATTCAATTHACLSAYSCGWLSWHHTFRKAHNSLELVSMHSRGRKANIRWIICTRYENLGLGLFVPSEVTI
jgi:hypothetical protein